MTKITLCWVYEVVIWDSVDSVEDKTSGTIYAGNYLEAVRMIYSLYGNSIIAIETLYPISETSLDVETELI